MRRTSHHESTTTMPTVNLLSPWSMDALATRRLRRRFAVGIVMMVLLLAAGWAMQHLRAAQAEQILAIKEAERNTLTSQTAELAPVRTFVTTVEKRKQTVSETMRTEIRFSRVLDELALATPADADLTNVGVTLAPPTTPAVGAASPGEDTASGDATAAAPADAAAATLASACPGPDPFGTLVVIGCLALSGTAASRDAVGQLVVELGRSPIFVEPFISATTTAEGSRVTFTGTVGISPKAFTGRYDQLDNLLQERDSR